MKLSEMCENIEKELPEELQKDLATVEIDGFAIGLKKNKWSLLIGHVPLFVLGGDNNYTTLFGLDKKYNDKVSSVADKLGINYANIGAIPRLGFFDWGKKTIAGGMDGDHFFKFRKYIADYRKKVD